MKTKAERRAEDRIDKLFSTAFTTNHPAIKDWVLIKIELKRLRDRKAIEETLKNIEELR